MPHKSTLKQLRVSYIASVFVILCLLLISQVVIQLTLQQEVGVRFQSNLLLTQALRVQRIQRNSLYFLENPGDAGTITQMQSDISFISQTENQLLNGGLSGDELLDLRQVDGSEQKMIGSAETILLLNQETPFPRTDKAKMQVFQNAELQVFAQQPVYLRGLVNINTILETQTNALILRIQLAEISLFTLSVLTVLAEYLFVARPGMRSVQEAFSTLQDAVNKVEDATQKEEEGHIVP